MAFAKYSVILALSAALTAACGQSPGQPKDKTVFEPGDSDSGDTDNSDPAQQSGLFSATHHTPGYFRATYGLLQAQETLDDATAHARLRTELQRLVTDFGDVPEMLDNEHAVHEGLVILAYRSVLAADENPTVARTIGEGLLRSSLGLDPAVDAFNTDHPEDPQPTTTGTPQTLAAAGSWTLRQAAADAPGLCIHAAFSSASFDPGEAEVAWVDEWCEDDRFVGGYCEPDRWFEGDCWEEWVPESCGGGWWEDRGYYDYYCYDDDDCRYIWRERLVYVDGHCTGGYYDEYCDSGYYEYGLCYDGTYVPGFCTGGYYEYRFPGGVWSFEQYATAPVECELVRPSQYAIASSAVGVLQAKVYDALDPQWQSAVDGFVDTPSVNTSREALYEAALQILDAVASAETTP